MARKPITEHINIEASLRRSGFKCICGVDEAGRGPLAGPVVAAAVVLPGRLLIDGLTDSKLLSAEKREEIYEQLLAEEDVHTAIGIMDHTVIDRINILQASLRAMRKAVSEIGCDPDVLLVDGNFTVPNVTLPQYAVIHGDRRCPSISAASIIAKVTRDRIMDHYAELHPQFTFRKHRGYSTPEHFRELREHGPCEIHRRSYAPVAQILAQYELFVKES
jgi:ribonuclease HII